MSALAAHCDTRCACQAIESHVQALKERFPQLKLSFGYIGNLTRTEDDRSWRVFTNRSRCGDAQRSLSWGGYATERLGEALAAIEAGQLLAFCEAAVTAPQRY